MQNGKTVVMLFVAMILMGVGLARGQDDGASTQPEPGNYLVLHQATDADLAKLDGMKDLAGLDLRGSQVTDAGLENLKDLVELQTLDLRRTKVTDAGMVYLKKLNQLHSLDIQGTAVTDAGMEYLKDDAEMEKLYLSMWVSDAGLEKLQGMKEMQTLNLAKSRVTWAGLKWLKEMRHLRSLSLVNTLVLDEGLANLKDFKELRELYLDQTEVTDDGLEQLKGLGLRTLSLSGTQITDEGLQHLKEMKGLKNLNLKGTWVTRAGVEDLQEALPGCVIQRSAARETGDEDQIFDPLPVTEADASSAPVGAAAHDAGAGNSIAAGWPVALAGRVYGTPAVADVEGNGKPCIIVPVIAFKSDDKLAHPKPSHIPLLYALHADGTAVKGWPITLSDSAIDVPKYWPWASSPSVYHDDAGDHIAIMSPAGLLLIINPDHTMSQLPGYAPPASSVPLVNLKQGGWSTVCGTIISTVEGQPIPSWPKSRKFKNGYAPAIGDGRGDGSDVFVDLFYTLHADHCPVGAYDMSGKRLKGWPQLISDASWFSPAMGHVTDDAGMQVVCAYGPHIFAWTLDGKPFACDTTDGDYTGVFKNGVEAQTATPTLVDLDGDGKAEIIVFDGATSSIRAWHGDGTGINSANDDDDDGSVIAKLRGQAHGVSVVSLGEDPATFDFFAGTFWVRWKRGAAAKVIDMCPDGNNETCWTQPTICDLFGDGKGEAIFGLSDGRVIVYKTGLAFHADRAPWPTAQGNFQRTSALALSTGGLR